MTKDEQLFELVRLLGSLAHEIKNPLSTIGMNVDLLAEDFAEPRNPVEQRALKKIERLQNECGRLDRILSDFLAFARAPHLELEPRDLNTLVEETLSLYTPQAEKAKIDVITYLAPNLPFVEMNFEAMQSVLLNLLLNAEAAMPEGGQLVIRTSIEDQAVRLELIDTGCGMDEQTRQKVFQPFFSTKRGGSGLGLSTAQRVVLAHGGTIKIESEPNQGTRFALSFPMPALLAASK